MVEIAISVAAKVSEYLVAPIVSSFTYIWNYKTNFENLEAEDRKLEVKRVTVQHLVEEARRNGDQIEQHVSDWLDGVNTMTDEVSDVIKENEPANMKCFKGLCPNPKKRYQHSRNAVKKAKDVARLYEAGNFPTVSFRTIPKETWIPSYKGYMVFESRMSTLKNILDALSNPDVNMVGIYGTGGIGKTTLAREIAEHAEDKKLFNAVAFAEVDVKPDIKNIQHEIADKLCFRFQDESPSGRARILQERLKQEEKVLLVLDNIWERLNLEDVGIPFGNDHKGCKLLLTARNLDVLSKMDSQRNFVVGFLDKGEAWSLFEKKAGSCDHLQALAKNVAEACGGLPIAIDSVAKALKTKEEFEWKDALRKLTTPSSSNFEGVAAETYSSIEISYSQLKERELKSTFLLCCIMEYTILEDFLSYGMGLGIFEDVEAMEDARNRVYTLVRKLKDSSLLLDMNNNKISLHDVVRDVGRSIASRDGHMFTVTNNCIPREWIYKDALKNCVGISLYNISKLPEEFEYPELQFFYLRTTSTDCCVPDNFFTGMPKLKVLHLVGLELYSVSNSIRLLVNLRTLCIDDCKLRDVNFIGEFKQLEILRIRDLYCYEIGNPCFRTVVDCLESESCHHFLFLQSLSLYSVLNLEMIHNYPLKKDSFRQLRTITVENCNKLKSILSFSTYRALPLLHKVDVSTCNNMEEIFAIKREEEINNIEGTDRIEFKHLSSLTLTSLPKLTSFCSINNNKDMFDTPTLLFNQKVVFSNLESLKLSSINFEKSWHNELPAISSCFQCLRLSIEKCTNLKVVAFSSLEKIEIFKMDDLEMMWPNQLCNDSFCNLKYLKVTKCNKLLTIFQSNMLERITRLESLTICDCDLVEKIFDLQGVDFEESHSEVESRLRELVIKCLPNLKHIWNKDPQKMFSFQKLNNVKVHHCMSLKYLFPVSIAKSLLELEQLDVYYCGVEEFVADDQGEAKVAATFVFPRMTSLKFNNLPLKTFYRGVHTSQWQNLKRLTMHDCNKVELFASDLFNFQENNEGQHGSSVQPLFIVEKVTFPSLEEIIISESNNLKILWQKGAKESFCNLKSVEVSGCDELLTIFQFNTLEGLSMPKLLTVTISNCASVEEIFDLQKVNFEESHSRAVMYHRLQQLNINWLPKLKHIWKKDPQAKLSFEELPMPESLRVSDCDSIEVIFDPQKVNFEESHSRPVTYRLQELDIRRLPKLKHIWTKDPQAELSFEELPMPKLLTVIDCDSIEEVFDLQMVNFEESHSGAVINHRLQQLNINWLPKLKHIWNKDPQAELSFENLQKVDVSNCESLKDLFPASVARSLSQLVELNVYGCGKLEEIVAKEGVAKEAARFVFPKVTSIRLDRLPELRTFYRGVHSSKWEVLKELEVVDCDKIELLASQLSCFRENNIDISVQPPLFLVEKDSFPILEKLRLIGEGTRMISQDQFSEELFCNLKFLQVYNDKSVVLFPLRILQRFHHLHELHLKSNSYKEIILFEKDETHVGVDSKLDMVLSKLEKLTVGDCQNLIQLVPSSTSFQNLTVLKVWGCHGLKNLMTSSTAKRLVQLREMEIGYCKSMIEVVAKGGDVTEDKIIFSKLRNLRLGDLPSLSCFCSENYTFELPSLEEIIVYRCHEMKYFSLGDITAQILQKVRRGSMNYTLEGGLNTTIQKTHNSRVDDSRDQELELYFIDLIYAEIKTYK